ncbi:mucolipin-3-like isoform X3 [Pseudoliparis swirei]|nr:mucolipin-3-like isoform X3 [Pseudoliparis swirei]XP_056270190.1 mucolipin-3-like isoform X3 [Pseudoliparis swirei]
MVVTFKEENLITFKHLFLKDYDDDGGMENYAVYSQPDVYDHIDYILKQYDHLHNITVGNHEYEKNHPMTVCQEFYRNASIFPASETFDIDIEVITECFNVYPMDHPTSQESSPRFILHFKRMLSVKITFVLKSINLQTVRYRELPDCYDFHVIEYTVYCKKECGNRVPWSDKLEFLNGWYILIIVSDVLTIIGSILKIEIQTKVLTSYDVCSIFLGTGTMFVWIGVIRYMGYFRKYNILILTMRAAFPNVIRFICCAGIIYMSYCFCGWIVLGPYHEKFQTLNTMSECLFSLINGDDMFATFQEMKRKSTLVWLFSRVYRYTFISLFIYMILNLFITIITDTYYRIKKQQLSGNLTSELHNFLSVCKDLPNSGMYRFDESKGFFLNGCITRSVILYRGHTRVDQWSSRNKHLVKSQCIHEYIYLK